MFRTSTAGHRSGALRQGDQVAVRDSLGHRPAEGDEFPGAGALVLVPVPDELKGPPQIELGTFQGDETAAPEGVPQGQPGDAADTETGFDGALDRFGMFQFETHRERRVMMTQRLIERLARS